MRRLRIASLLIILAPSLAPLTPAYAQPPPATPPLSADAQRAEELKKRGNDALDAGNPAEALSLYSEAYALSHDPALLYNRGRALQALTQYSEALAELEKFRDTAPAELKARVPGLEGLIAGVRAKVARLTVVCNVTGARVRLRDRTLGTTPLAELGVNAGHATLEVTADGYFPAVREVDLPGGGASHLEVLLESKATSGLVTIGSPVTGTDVVVDAKPAGKVPVELVLRAGSHSVSLRHAGYKGVDTSFVLAAGERKSVSLPLESEPPITAKWWFWTGITVAVAGGVVLAIALTTERSPDRGTIAPGQVSSGLFRF